MKSKKTNHFCDSNFVLLYDSFLMTGLLATRYRLKYPSTIATNTDKLSNDELRN